MKKYMVVFKWVDILYLTIFGIILYVYLKLWTYIPEATIILFAFFLVAAIVFFYINRWQNYTLRFMVQFAKKYKFKSVNLKFKDLAFSDVDLFNTGGDAYITDCYRTNKVFMYNFRRPAVVSTDYGRKEDQSIPTWFIVFDFRLGKNFEPITIFNKRDSRKFKVIHGKPSITTESNQFNNRYLIYGKNRKTVLEILDPIVMSVLLDCREDINFEIAENRLLVYKCSKPKSVEFLDNLYRVGQAIAQRFFTY